MEATPPDKHTTAATTPARSTRPGEAIPPTDVSAELPSAARETLPAPEPGQRYHLRGLTELWARELVEQAERDGRDPHTARSYTHAVARWLRFCQLENIDPLAARRADVDHWVSGLDVGPATVRTRLAGVSSWYGYLIDNDAATSDPAARVKRPKHNRRSNGSDTAWLSDEELNALLAEATRRAENADPETLETAVRDAAVLRVLITTGVRSGAVRNARLPDDLGTRGGHRLLHYRTKGGGQSAKPLVPYAAAMVDNYLRLRAARQNLDTAQLTGPLFAGTPYRGKPGGRPLSNSYLANMLRRTATAAGINDPERLVPHSTRHSVATSLGKRRSLAEVQTYLDHADPRTTRLYLRVDENLNNSPAYTMAGVIDDPHE
ncbi:tyrosine-type recombinase/integrase [Actinopolyspora saharensis]|uniref:Site-specific recombinase XerD n=1 Tax=Actinopolyspora saharensis TaxID=995062 RepID=A0A1H0ZPT7_9ACTN|nr:tyrosine-type recombinase/integrase [Actinopolyspora saharensis]SDQ29036.1 Site-specific recombinase XerD [Actinopolyspora saharensis]